ncbi:MAG: serine/threonine protein kinase [Deltaproteobacteria bacterium]|nr:serine/threonine protein kinase [Deltaproteobacteria bacterium]
MSDVFISYTSSDRQTAQKFAAALETYGWSVWWDREIPVGKNFDQVIEEELSAARCVVVLWSKESVQSRWVKTEASAAADRDRLAPVLIDETAIPLEFRRIETAMLPEWDGDTANPDFQKLVQAVRDLVGRSEPVGRVAAQKTQNKSGLASTRRISPRSLGAIAAVLLIVGGLVLAKKAFHTTPQETTSPSSNSRPQNPNSSSPVKPGGASAASPSAFNNRQIAPSKATFPIKIGDKIDDGVPAPGAGRIETPYAQDIYSFAATAGQRVYFRMLRHSDGLSYIKWRVADADGTEIFNTCLGCSEPGVQILTKGGNYTLTVGSDNDPATGTYQLQLFNVPAPNRFSIQIGDTIKENSPGPGAGTVESPGAESIYSFSAAPRQNVYFRMIENSNGMSYIKWTLVDDNGMEVFNTCLGCSEPGVQTLIKGGDYTLTVGNKTDPSTGTYRLQLFDVPPPNQFSIKIGDKIGPGVPGPGAGVVETPGAEDIYIFSAPPGQIAYFRLLKRDKGMDYIKWRLVDANSTEIFNTCLGCSEPGVQTLAKGGEYTLIVGNRTDPATGNYIFDTGSR